MKDIYKSIRYEASQGFNDHLWQIPEELLEKYSDMIALKCMQLCLTAVGNQDYNTGRIHCAQNIKEIFKL